MPNPHAETLRAMAAEIVAAFQQNRPARQPKDGDVSALVYGAQCIAIVERLASVDPLRVTWGQPEVDERRAILEAIRYAKALTTEARP